MMDQGKLLFVVEIPPNFEADIRAQRKTGIQINVDATAVAQAGNGASYLKTAIANEIQRFISGKRRLDRRRRSTSSCAPPSTRTSRRRGSRR